METYTCRSLALLICIQALRKLFAKLSSAFVTLAKVRSAALWWDTVREARNVLRWEVEPTFVNNFDKVSALMLSAASHLRALWRVKTAALNTTL